MNTKTLAAALTLSFAATTAIAGEPRVNHIVDLPAVQVRPGAALQAELAGQPPITTLAAVQVRPTLAQQAERLAVLAMQQRVVDLATVYVQPTADQLAERAAVVAREHAHALAAQVGHTLAEQALVSAAR